MAFAPADPVTLDPRAVGVFAALAVLLWIKGLVVSWVQVRTRVRRRAFARPEDAAMMRTTPAPEPLPAQRAADAWRNETENGPAFLAIAVAAVLTGVPWVTLAVAAALFLLVRCVHAWIQIAGLQPHRTLAWLGGVATTLALACAVTLHVLEDIA